MTAKMVSGNEAIALGALRAGVKVVSGYPGTPSTEVITSLWNKDLPGTSVEWSTNEKVAFEVAAASAMVGSRAMCTMKMSGVNVAYDSIIGIAYSGCTGGLVIYVADDPGVNAGMCEQDSRDFAVMADMPMLEPGTLQEAYDLTQYAFELSEAIQSPVFIRSTTNVAQSHGMADVAERVLPVNEKPMLERNIAKYTKAGAVIAMNQHRELLERLEKAKELIAAKQLNRLKLSKQPGGLGIVSVGVVNGYVEEALSIADELRIPLPEISSLQLINTIPFAVDEMKQLLKHCSTVLVAEELEPLLENRLYMEAYKLGVKVEFVGKNDATFSRIGEYDAKLVLKGICKALHLTCPEEVLPPVIQPEQHCAARPITTCAGCPHRGTYMAINKALRNLKFKSNEIIVTGDIGCTILGINPPFNTLWTEVSMGASIPMAQGFIYGGVQKPVLATIGDSTFFHAGIPGLINAIQHNVNLTVVVMDNGWTAMTGMQVNPGTIPDYQQASCRQLDLEKVIAGLGVDHLITVDPYDLKATTAAIEKSIALPGVKVVLARRECAIQAARRKVAYEPIEVNIEKCTRCKSCIVITGCPAISLGEHAITIDRAQCNGCGLCMAVCPTAAIVKEGK
ncbi:hypothetical protein P22_2070 [Propionispora sp. 2/2-37]|uniref:thiamine pyrophosphate-dependent enzyme n=1 Tax=Propionispora sp. 2/2-37 TaxID=1677858 RepID=UPI0006C18065|nr:thiamine pyrophosphate-dependent enzyme [Propionispora sp. 2/2-37]CUH95982.1 hypothetical protein P22_2070 [Propionispora sp. 2/2-37]